MSEINVVDEVQRLVRNQISLLRRVLVDAGAHPLEAEAITVEDKPDGVVVTVGKVTAAARKAYDREHEAPPPDPLPAPQRGGEGFRLDEDAALGEEIADGDAYEDDGDA